MFRLIEAHRIEMTGFRLSRRFRGNDEKGAIISSFPLSASLSAAGEAFEEEHTYAELTFARGGIRTGTLVVRAAQRPRNRRAARRSTGSRRAGSARESGGAD